MGFNEVTTLLSYLLSFLGQHPAFTIARTQALEQECKTEPVGLSLELFESPTIPTVFEIINYYCLSLENYPGLSQGRGHSLIT